MVGPLLQPKYHWGGHDARHSVYFLEQFNLAIREGIGYPRWAPDFAFGYGYPFFNIYGPFSSYAGQLFLFLGADSVTAVKIVFGLSAVLSGLTMYLFGRAMFNPPAGLIAALVYVYLPYHLFDLYVRAALAESVGLVFIPLTMWGFYLSLARPRLSTIGFASVAYALLMFTSNLLALIFTPIFGLYVATMLLWQFWHDPLPHEPESQPERENRRLSLPKSTATRSERLKQPRRYGRLIIAGLPPLFVLLLGLGLSGIFWIPAFLEYRYVRVDQWIGGRFAFGDDFVELFQLFSPRWGFGTSIPGPDDEAGFQIGLPATILFMLSFLAVPQLKQPAVRRSCIFFQAFTLIVIFLMTPMSYWVWAILPLSSFAQFPWRLLVVIAPFIAILAGTVMTTSSFDGSMKPTMKRTIPLPVISLTCLIILSSYPYLHAEARDPKPTEGPPSQLALYRFQQSSDEMTGQTAWTQQIPNWSVLAEQVAQGGDITTKVNYSALPADDSVGVYSMKMSSVHELLWVGTAQANHHVTFFIPYYPGWRAYIYEDLGPHDGNLDETVGPVSRVGAIVSQPRIGVTAREGWMTVPIPEGSHFLEIRFEDTIVRLVGYWVSSLSVILVIILLILSQIRLTHNFWRN